MFKKNFLNNFFKISKNKTLIDNLILTLLYKLHCFKKFLILIIFYFNNNI